MKIALIVPYDFAIPGGVKNHVAHLAREFTYLGHTVHILAPASAQPETIEGVMFIWLGKPSRARWAPHIFLNPRAIVQLRRQLLGEHYDIVHLHEPLTPPLCFTALLCSSAITIGTFHAYRDQGNILYRALRWPLKHLLNRLVARIAVSLSAQKYNQLYFQSDYTIIPNGVDVQRFSVTKPLSLPYTENKINILFVGHQQSKRKGLYYLLQAYRQLKPHYPSLQLIIAGVSLPGRKSLNEMNGAEFSDVLFLGMVEEDELIALYQTTDIFCSPALGDESFGIVLLEAMASGTAIVASNIAGYRNVISDEQEGLLVPPKNSTALANALERLINNPVLRRELGERGKLTAQKYAWPQIAADVLDYYCEYIK